MIRARSRGLRQAPGRRTPPRPRAPPPDSRRETPGAAPPPREGRRRTRRAGRRGALRFRGAPWRQGLSWVLPLLPLLAHDGEEDLLERHRRDFGVHDAVDHPELLEA